jgi:hypothetical protein
MNAKKSDGSKDPAAEDFGLKDKYQEYHDHGGPQGDDRARELEGDIASAHLRHEDDLSRGRPDSSVTGGK